MDRIKNIIKSQEGAALILVLFLITIIVIGTSALLLNSFYSTENSVYGERKLEATHIAKGGIEEGLAYIEGKLKDDETIDNHTISRLNQGWYDVEIIKTSDETFSVISIAKYKTVFGERDITYVVNGEFSEGSSGNSIGGLNSTFFDNAVVTSYPLTYKDFSDGSLGSFAKMGGTLVTVDGDFYGKPVNINWASNETKYILMESGNIYDSYSQSEFTTEYNNLKAQIEPLPTNLNGTQTYPEFHPVIDRVISGVQELSIININSNANRKITFTDDVFVNELNIRTGSANVIFEGLVHANNIYIANSSSGSVHFKGNVVADNIFDMRSSGYNLTVDGIILTNTFEYIWNSNEDYSVPYVVAKESIDIRRSDNKIMNTGGLAAPSIRLQGGNSKKSMFYISYGSGGGSGGTSETGSYTITDWYVE